MNQCVLVCGGSVEGDELVDGEVKCVSYVLYERISFGCIGPSNGGEVQLKRNKIDTK